MINQIKRNNKKGLSGVVTALLLVLLSVVLVGIVWVAIQDMIKKELPEQECINAFEKVTLDSGLTCYLGGAGDTKEMQFSISVADMNVEKLLVTFGGTTSGSVEIPGTSAVVANVRPYGGLYTDAIGIPGKNAGLTYAYNLTAGGFTQAPTYVKVTPFAGGEACPTSDQITEIDPCILP